MVIRRIREHVATHNWFAVGIDLAIVVVGVFLGIQASNWNAARIQSDEVLKWLDRYVRNHTVNRFGPVRELDRSLVLEVAFDSIHKSTRHKSGLAMRFPRISRIRTDKPAHEADRIETLLAMVT